MVNEPEGSPVAESVEDRIRRRAGGKGADEERTTPPVPDSLEDTGLSAPFVDDLLLKTHYRQGPRSGDQLSGSLRLPFSVLDDRLLSLQQRHMLEVRETKGQSRRGYVFDLTGEGRKRAAELVANNAYVGSAPVPVDQYWRWVEGQRLRGHRLSREEIEEGFDHLVLDRELLDSLGPAINSAGSLFLYGPAGNGKTAIAEAIASMFGGEIFIPRTVEIEGQIVQLYDPFFHEKVDDEDQQGRSREWLRAPPDYDQRFVKIERPVVIVGGELTLDQLELQHDESMGLFRAPPQVKANGGVFVIDDFGRQIIRPRDLLNRWMYPLERNVDYLSLPTGQKLMVPFECLLIFATNLDPADLVEEAFLRRIRYKILVDDPDREQYEEIFRQRCERHGIEYRPGAAEYVFREFYGDRDLEPRACHPRDIVRHLLDLAAYRGREPGLSDELLEEACTTYFLETGSEPGTTETVAPGAG